MPRVLVRFGFEAIRFECQKCGSCCHHKRPTQFGGLLPLEKLNDFCNQSNLIYLTNRDIVEIGRKTGLEAMQFVDTLYEYDGNCVKVEDAGKKVILDLPVMKSKADVTCIFYQKRCKVYDVRPRACQLFPFRVDEETSREGDILLNISYNPHCPGIGKGMPVNKSQLERIVIDQFLERAEQVAREVQTLQEDSRIVGNARIFRSIPGLKSGIKT